MAAIIDKECEVEELSPTELLGRSTDLIESSKFSLILEGIHPEDYRTLCLRAKMIESDYWTFLALSILYKKGYPDIRKKLDIIKKQLKMGIDDIFEAVDKIKLVSKKGH